MKPIKRRAADCQRWMPGRLVAFISEHPGTKPEHMLRAIMLADWCCLTACGQDVQPKPWEMPRPPRA